MCQELHKDGTPHLHAFAKYGSKKNFKDPKCFDLNGHHGNYQTAKSYYAVCKYVRKSGDYIEEGMDALAEEDARTSKKAIFSRQVMKASKPQQIKELIDENPERLIGLHNIMKDYREYRNLSIE